jgi:hypothetical protein
MTTQVELDFNGPALRDAGITKVLSNNEDYAQAFDAAAGTILDRQGSVTSEEVVHLVGMPTGHPNAVGAAMRRFALANDLKILLYRKSARPSCHSAIIAVWTQ